MFTVFGKNTQIYLYLQEIVAFSDFQASFLLKQIFKI